jgi:DnaJ family protein C protein 13
VLDTPAVRTNMAAARSYHAVLAAQALGRLAGMLAVPNRTPDHPAARSCLAAALTESLAMRLGDDDPHPLLVDLNSSLESAQVRQGWWAGAAV